ncbi:hypothetical protein EST38_g5666 [Candolleomyces aberdarensis]|uniref:Uncharacterized protein n=1 Tax=Candolleomyces aberdarensis TaxID=2316362 RepID=A0A4V1Q3Y1_9AGAR|nr:hypothetical protein EST38_g5666 [Candolleomyces aberdarensis]
MGSKSTPPPSYVNYADLEVLATTATADELGLEFFKKFHVLRAYTVEWGKKRLRLAAGIAHGIRKNARFTLYQNIEALRDGSKPLGQTKESEIGAFSTLLLPLHNMSSDFPASCIAIQTESSDPEGLRVHAPAEILHLPLFKEIASSFSGKGINDPCRIKLVDKAEAQLEIVPAGGSQVTFNVLDEFSTNCGFTRLPHVVDLYDGSLGRILCSAARYYLQLNIQHTSYPEPLEKPKVELFLLKEQCGEDDEVVLIPGEEYMYRGAMIEIEVDEETKYGIKIWNHEDVDLGLVCFYFDHANLSISDFPH